MQDISYQTIIPTAKIGPIKINYQKTEFLYVPLATFETPLWLSTKRGALVSQKSDGINVSVIDDFMSRSVIFEAEDLAAALKCKKWLEENFETLNEIVAKGSRIAKLKNVSAELIGKLIYLRINITAGNAAGHNMVTGAADHIMEFVTNHFEGIKYVSISGNFCTDKKVSAVNGICGRGKRVTAELVVKKSVCEYILKTSPEKIVELNTKKNLIGSILAGSLRSANAHFANILLAMYLSTGQDAANIVEASQGITYADLKGEDLYFSVNLPNIIVGTVGNGKNLDFALENLKMMGCDPENEGSSKKLAAVIASAALCSELSLLAAQINPGELMKVHTKLERRK